MASEKKYASVPVTEQLPDYPGLGVAYAPPPPDRGDFTPIQPVQGLPPSGYYPGQPVAVQPAPGQQVVLIQQDIFRDAPVTLACPNCGQHIITNVNYEAGGFAWLLCCLMALFGLWLGCCLIPFCVDGCQDVRHSCPNCNKTLHVYKRM